jgi:DNA (cytosine-5)-methyltransferase 1
LNYLSVCSGIEAASVAWGPLGWTAAAFSEIEKFPCAVLAHHYPGVPNLGDMTLMDVEPLGRIDILVGGTPCQAFSVAGLRQSLDDARGNLTLSYVRLVHELVEHHALRNAVWENVPGVLSTKDNAFGCFLGALVGSDEPLVPSPKPADGKSDAHWKWSKGRHSLKWPNSGMVSGPEGRAAWTIKDAQYFGLAQRRRRVFVVSDFGNGADPAAVLFELEGVPGNPAPRREQREDVTHPIAPSLTSSGRGIERTGDTRGQDPVVAVQVPSTGDLSHCLNAGGMGRIDYETETMIATSVALRGREGGGTAELGGDIATALRASTGGGDKPHVLAHVVSIHSDAIGRSGDALTPSPDAAGVVRLRNPGIGIIDDGTMYNLMANGSPHAVSVTGEISHTFKAEGFDASEDGTGRGNPIIAFSSKDYGADAGELSSTLRAGGHSESHANAGVPPAIVFNPKMGGHPTMGLGVNTDGTTYTLDAVGNSNAVQIRSAVRRLTPVECERLQGFPDDYTRIPMPKSGKKVGLVWAADGPRYKALGNSMAVPVMRWIGERIDRLMPVTAAAPKPRFNFGRLT